MLAQWQATTKLLEDLANGKNKRRWCMSCQEEFRELKVKDGDGESSVVYGCFRRGSTSTCHDKTWGSDPEMTKEHIGLVKRLFPPYRRRRGVPY